MGEVSAVFQELCTRFSFFDCTHLDLLQTYLPCFVPAAH